MSYFDDDDKFKEGSDNDDDDDNESTSSDDEEIEENDDENNQLYGGAGEEFDIEENDDDEKIDDDDDDNDDNDDNDEEINKTDPDDLEEGENYQETKAKKTKTIPTKNVYKKPDDFIDDDEDDDEDGEQYLQKFDRSVNDNYILNFHPESVSQNYNEILSMTNVVRNNNGIIIDKLHRTIPYLTKYEKARILGQRAKQINSGAYPFVKVPENVIDGYIIAEMELKQKRIPFIIRRPLPNGGSEYWKVKDLEDISF